jgi:hypothetical protein
MVSDVGEGRPAGCAAAELDRLGMLQPGLSGLEANGDQEQDGDDHESETNQPGHASPFDIPVLRLRPRLRLRDSVPAGPVVCRLHH